MTFSILAAITWNIDPVIFTIRLGSFELPITWYGLFFASSFLIGQQIMTYIFRTEGKPRKDVDDLIIYAMIGTVVGARLGHYLFYEWPLLFNSPFKWFIEMVTPPFAGLASHGATIAIPICLYLYSRKKTDQPFLWVIDRVVITVSLAGALIRLGNLMNSEIYGKPTSMPWGFLFMRETDPAYLPIVPRHPTGLYEALFCLILLAITFYLWKHKRHQINDGIITGTFIILLFSFRIVVEFFKNNQSSFENSWSFNMGQWLSVPAIIGGILIMRYALRHPTKKEELTSSDSQSVNL